MKYDSIWSISIKSLKYFNIVYIKFKTSFLKTLAGHHLPWAEIDLTGKSTSFIFLSKLNLPLPAGKYVVLSHRIDKTTTASNGL